MLRIGLDRDLRSDKGDRGWLGLLEAATLDAPRVVRLLGSTRRGLTRPEARRRIDRMGPNTVGRTGTGRWSAIAREILQPLNLALGLVLGLDASGSSSWVGVCAGGLLALSVGWGLADEIRLACAVGRFHARVRHTIPTQRNGRSSQTDVTELVPGDVVSLSAGSVVPADLRILESEDLHCDERIFGGEEDARKSSDACADPASPAPSCCLFMGSLVRSGSALAIVVRTGTDTTFAGLTERLEGRTEASAFETALADAAERVRVPLVAAALAIALLGVALGRHGLEVATFALAPLVGCSPWGATRRARIELVRAASRLVAGSLVVKRASVLEDLAGVDTIVIDPEGTLWEPHPSVGVAVDESGAESSRVIALALACGDALPFRDRVIGGQAADRALFEALGRSEPPPAPIGRLDFRPFDEATGLAIALVEEDGARHVVLRGDVARVRERVIDHGNATPMLRASEGSSVAIAVAVAPVAEAATLGCLDSLRFRLAGVVTLEHVTKPDVVKSYAGLRDQGIDVKLLAEGLDRRTLDLCDALGIDPAIRLEEPEIARAADRGLAEAALRARLIVARSPHLRAKLLLAMRSRGASVAFVGNSVSDAATLREATVAVTTDAAPDGVRDAADVLLVGRGVAALERGIVAARAAFFRARRETDVLVCAGWIAAIAGALAICTPIHSRLFPVPTLLVAAIARSVVRRSSKPEAAGGLRPSELFDGVGPSRVDGVSADGSNDRLLALSARWSDLGLHRSIRRPAHL